MEWIISEVCDGNFGARQVVRDLAWFSSWSKLIKYIYDIGLRGSYLWIVYKEKYNFDWHRFGRDLEWLIREENKMKRGLMKRPKRTGKLNW